MHPFAPLVLASSLSLSAAVVTGASKAAAAPQMVAAPASPAETRLAIVVGNNGSPTLRRAELRYADDDAAKYASLLGAAAGGGDLALITRMDADTARLFPAQAAAAQAPTRAALEAAIAQMEARARAAKMRGDRVVFTFVFAGHGDIEEGRGFLELEDGRFFREDLEAMLLRIPAERAHVILDACNSVYMLASRKPGGTRFATPEDVERSMRARLPHVGTFLSTSADAQVYEWSQIESGVFSHAVRSGLAGAADLNGDGRITYGELRAFVRVAASGVPNPRFRPRIYARGPEGRDDEVLFAPRAVGAQRKLALDAGTERRVRIADANEVPLLEVRLEADFGTSVWLPGGTYTLSEQVGTAAERRTEIKAAASDGALVAMGNDRPAPAPRATRAFEHLFTMPFGPRAVAGLAPEKASEEVYGVGLDDRERMARLLDMAAETQRDRRLSAGIAAGGVGLIFASAGAVFLSTRTNPDKRGVVDAIGGSLLGLGALSLGFSAWELLSKSRMEARRDAFAASLKAYPEAFDLAVRDAEAELLSLAAAQKRWRTVGGVLLTGAGVVALGFGLLGELSAQPNDSRFFPRMLLGIGASYSVLGPGLLLLRSEEERTADLWRKETSPRAAAAASLRVKPLVGLGMLGMQGTF